MQNTKLATRLLAMAKTDQDMREKSAKDMSLWDESIDKKHTARLKSIIKEYGWPTITLVGERASRAAWLLVQHADHDRGFQKDCLKIMKGLPSGEASLADI